MWSDHHASKHCQPSQLHCYCCYPVNPTLPRNWSAADFAVAGVQNERRRFRWCRRPRHCAASVQREPALIYLLIYTINILVWLIVSQKIVYSNKILKVTYTHTATVVRGVFWGILHLPLCYIRKNYWQIQITLWDLEVKETWGLQ